MDVALAGDGRGIGENQRDVARHRRGRPLGLGARPGRTASGKGLERQRRGMKGAEILGRHRRARDFAKPGVDVLGGQRLDRRGRIEKQAAAAKPPQAFDGAAEQRVVKLLVDALASLAAERQVDRRIGEADMALEQGGSAATALLAGIHLMTDPQHGDVDQPDGGGDRPLSSSARRQRWHAPRVRAGRAERVRAA